MTALLLDDMFSGAIAEQLRGRGVEAIAVVEDAVLIGPPDEDLLAHATCYERVLATADVADLVSADSEVHDVVMGKPSKRLNRRVRTKRGHARLTALPAPAGGLRIVIATAPNSAGEAAVSLDEDVRLVKSALLYADRVELISPGAEMVGGTAALGAGGADAMLEMFAALEDEALAHLSKSDPEKFREILRIMR